jgi:hypothetical protein
MENDSRPLSRNPCVAALSKPRYTSTDEHYGGVSLALLSGRAVTEGMIRMAKCIMHHSLVVVAVHQGDEVLAQLPGTIIRSDGVVATCASGLSFRIVKELRVTVKVLGEQVTHEGALLDADFSSKFAFIKFKSPEQQKVPTFAKGFGMRGVAVGCTSQGPELRYIDFNYLPALICGVVNENKNKQSHAMTSGRVVQAFPEGVGNFIGGALVEPWGGLIGVIHYQYGSEIKATPMDEVLKCLEHLENRE